MSETERGAVRFVVAVFALVLDFWAIIAVWDSSATIGVSSRVLWSLALVIVPLIGFAYWFITSPPGTVRRVKGGG